MDAAPRRRPAHIALARQFGIAIVTGEIAPAAVLPSEVDLAQRYRVSRSVIREALRIIAAKGLIESRQKAGTRVRDRAAWNLLDPDMLGWMFEGAPSPAFVASLFELRMIVEPAAAELAAGRRTAAQLAGMERALADMAAHGLASEPGRAADQAFHALILEATANELLTSLSAGITAAVRWTTVFKARINRQSRDPMPAHHALLAAIAEGDPAASRSATTALLQQARSDTEDAIGAADRLHAAAP